MNGAVLTWIDGVAGSQIDVRDRGLQYGDGLFETMVVRAGRIRFLGAHLDRLIAGAARLRLEPCDRSQLQSEWQTGARELGTGTLKALLTRGDAVLRGYAPSQHARARRILLGYRESLPSAPESAEVWCCRTQLGENPALAGMKTLNRLEQVLAAAEWQQAARDLSLNLQEGLLTSTRGNFVSGTATNLFLRVGRQLRTPSLERCGITGVIRRIVARDAGQLNFEFVESDIQLPDVLQADEIFLTNVRWPVLPVRSLHYDGGRNRRDWSCDATGARLWAAWLAGIDD